MTTKVSKDFLGKINNLNDEQKRMLVDILVDKVLVSEDENKNLRIRVIFRFNVDVTDSNDDNLELNYGA